MKFMATLWNSSEKRNLRNILSLLEENRNAEYLDLGCSDGNITKVFLGKIKAKKVSGADLINTAKDIPMSVCDLNKAFPFQDDRFDVITANQVIEHLYNTDVFLEELKRVLKTGGYAIISTENLSSWHNIFPLLFGWQPFSLTNISNKGESIGNPISLHRGENSNEKSFQHIRVMSYRALKELFEAHGFFVEKIKGAGYYPFGFLQNADIRHSHFLTFKLRKSLK